MSTPVHASPASSPGAPQSVRAAIPATRLMYWSVRRELWENRSIYIAPLAAAAVGMLAFFIGLVHLPRSHAHSANGLVMPYTHLAWLVMLTAFIVGVFYSLDALHGERRDRSILFWKSLPVSDLTTVLAKAVIPLVVLPLLVFAIAVLLQWVMLLLNIVAVLMSGGSAAALWRQLPLFQSQLVLLYCLIVLAVCHAPIYAWLLLVSGWARRAPFLWAVLPPLAIGIFERIAFHTTYFGSQVGLRLFGFAQHAFDLTTPGGAEIDPHFIPLARITPGRLLAGPELWIGLAVAAALLAAAVRLRRYRDPI